MRHLQPQGIFMLGGGADREELTAKLAAAYPDLPVWISGGSHQAPELLAQYEVDLQRVIFDNRATDTVTNFTTNLQSFKQHNLGHVFMVTSDFHMARAKAIAGVILGFYGITTTPVPVPSGHMKEPRYVVLRDVVRSFVWLLTGHSGASLKEYL
jgi:uncharacterized SAM-binding protein YcdF (DUF218 family)